MTYSHTGTNTTTSTDTDAVHIAAKVGTDLKRMQRFYGEPTDEWIQKFETEVIIFLEWGYLGTVTYGFKKDGLWIEPTLSYTARDLSDGTANDDDPGRIMPGASIKDATFCSYLTYSLAWNQLSPEQKEAFEKQLPFQRTAGPEPSAMGDWNSDLTYSSGSRALDRAILRSRQ